MFSKPRRTIFSLKSASLAAIATLLALCATSTVAASLDPRSLTSKTTPSNVACREHITDQNRIRLASSLRKISGWPDLGFDQDGFLRGGTKGPFGGSKTARELLVKVILGTNAVVLEDVSHSSEVAFMRVVPARWKTPGSDSRPAFVVQIDFSDFDQVMGDEQALQAFDVGWGLLHELDHVAYNSEDGSTIGDTGECESRINRMRAECNLPQRTEYFYTPSPLTRDTTFATRLVRLAFEHSNGKSARKRRYWVMWDANLVGGLAPGQIAALR